MQRTLRGVLRFSCGGLTYLRIASRLDVSAPSETSAQTGRRTSLRGLFCVPAMCLPNKIVYDIPSPPADSQFACRVNDNPPLLSKLVAFRARISRAQLGGFSWEIFLLFPYGL